jgi:hypothetical protein
VRNSRNCSGNHHWYRAQFQWVLFGSLLSIQTSLAGEVLESYVGNEGDHFRVHIDMLIEAQPERVRALLTDYASLNRLSPSITASELLYIGSGSSLWGECFSTVVNWSRCRTSQS